MAKIIDQLAKLHQQLPESSDAKAKLDHVRYDLNMALDMLKDEINADR